MARKQIELEVEGPEMAIVGESAAKRVCGRLTEGGCCGMGDSLCGGDAQEDFVFDAAASSGPETSGPLRVARDARDSLCSPCLGDSSFTRRII
jgi:hypothetical protein